MAASDERPIVVDNGRNHLKAGYAGDSAPRILIPMLTGRQINKTKQKDWFVGEDAYALRHELALNCPISNGTVTDIEGLSIIWYYMFMKELRTNPTNHSILLTEHPLVPKSNREIIAEMVFERFQVPAIYITSQSVLSLYAVGQTTGLVFDMGTDTSNVVPICNTYPVVEASNCRAFGGDTITAYLRHMLVETHPFSSMSITEDFTKKIKEKLCYVTANPLEDLKLLNSTPGVQNVYKTPDGHLIRVAKERFMAPELIFDPRLYGLQGSGIHHTINNSIQHCPDDVRQQLYSNIVLSGGGTLFTGFVDRLKSEIKRLAPANTTINVVKPSEQQYAVWIGGSILASLSTFTKICVKRQEYDEHGPSILHVKCT